MSENNGEKKAVKVWSNDALPILRKNLYPTLTDQEFVILVGMGRRFNADPYKRQIWAVKYEKTQPASIFLARDFYRKEAQKEKTYDGHYAEAVYSNDEFRMVDGVPHHEWELKDRGELLGAYGVAYRKGIKKPFFVFAPIKEYNKNHSTWRTMPETMIKKVGEAQVLRMAFMERFEGTYDESEQAAIEAQYKVQPSRFDEKPPQVKGKQSEAASEPPSEKAIERLKEEGINIHGSEENFNNWLSFYTDGKILSVKNISTQRDYKKIWAGLRQYQNEQKEKNEQS